MCKVPHEITLFAFTTNGDGTRSLYDIIPTSFKNASFFARKWHRNEEITHVAACAAKDDGCREPKLKIRSIR